MNEAVGNFFGGLVANQLAFSDHYGVIISRHTTVDPRSWVGLTSVWVQPRSLEVATLRSELTLGPEIHIPVLEMPLKI